MWTLIDTVTKWSTDKITRVKGFLDHAYKVLTSYLMTIYDIALEWIKLTMSLFLFLAVPFSLYMIWDMVASDLSMTTRIYEAIGSFAQNNLGIYFVALSIIVYLTYL